MEQFLRIGVITRSHGVHGEVKVFPTTDSPKRFEEVSKVYIRTPKGDIEAEVEGVKYFNSLAIVKFSCFGSPEEIQGYAGSDVMISREDAQPLEEGEYYIGDLIGCRVVADENSESCPGIALGTLKDVLQTGANDVYVVQTKAGGEILLPVIPQCIKNVDIVNNIITVNVMKGLLDD